MLKGFVTLSLPKGDESAIKRSSQEVSWEVDKCTQIFHNNFCGQQD